jgi:hypothetical protein
MMSKQAYEERNERWRQEHAAKRKAAAEAEFGSYKVGDGVSWGAGTDTHCGTIVEISKSQKSIKVVGDKATLLNAVDSGEPDALHFSPGGFVGHTSGEQRYEFDSSKAAAWKKGDPAKRFTWRAKLGRYKEAGTSSTGSMVVWGNLSKGRAYHYDYNF